MFKLQRNDLAKEVSAKYHREKDARKKIRLLAMHLAAKGEMSASEIAEICSCSRATILYGSMHLDQVGLRSS